MILWCLWFRFDICADADQTPLMSIQWEDELVHRQPDINRFLQSRDSSWGQKDMWDTYTAHTHLCCRAQFGPLFTFKQGLIKIITALEAWRDVLPPPSSFCCCCRDGGVIRSLFTPEIVFASPYEHPSFFVFLVHLSAFSFPLIKS